MSVDQSTQSPLAISTATQRARDNTRSPSNRSRSEDSCHHSRHRDDAISLTAKSMASRSSRGSHHKARSTISPESVQRTVAGEPPTPEKATIEDDQEYWAGQVAHYQMDQSKEGPEITSSLTGACKVFWQKAINEDTLKQTLESSKVPSNCQYLRVQQVNREIWSCTSGRGQTERCADLSRKD